MISSTSVEEKSDGKGLFNDILKGRMNKPQKILMCFSWFLWISSSSVFVSKENLKRSIENVNFRNFEKQTDVIHSIMFYP